MLKAGGSAVDGAIAANLCEGVVEPMMNGMGGDLMAQVWHGPTKKLHGYNGSGRSPHNLTYARMQELLRELGEQRIPGEGPLGVSVPGAVLGWWDLHQKFGRLPWATLFEPAIAYASRGHPVAQVIAAEWYVPPNSSALTSGGKYPHALDGFLQTFTVTDAATGKRRTPRAGEVFTNPALADTLRLVAAGGAAAFYNGTVAAAYEAYGKVSGLQLTAADFAAHHGEWVEPVSTSYRDDYEVYELPPNPQGIAALQQLNILELHDLAALEHNGADYLHLHVEAKKLAFADRAKFYADPEFGGPSPALVRGLISKEYAKERNKLINMTRAAKEVAPGTPPSEAAVRLGMAADGGGAVARPHVGGHHVSDGGRQRGDDGVAHPEQLRGLRLGPRRAESRLWSAGSRIALQHGEGLGESVHAGQAAVPHNHPGVCDAARRQRLTEQPWMSFGVMGGNIQPQGHAQILTNIIDFGMNPQEAGDAARYTHSGSSQPTGQVMDDGGTVQLEGGVCAGVRAERKARGHRLTAGANGGGYQSITLENGVYVGASEMRKDGMAAGY